LLHGLSGRDNESDHRSSITGRELEMGKLTLWNCRVFL
jgi:hypothetical protein